MVATVTVFLWLSIAALSSAELAAAGNHQSTNGQCVVSLLVQQAVQLQQQSDQLNRLQKRLKSLETSLESRTAQLTALTQTVAKQGKGSSFRAVLKTVDVPSNTPIHFHEEFATGGRLYDPNTGIYTVGTPGVYSFGFQLFPQFLSIVVIDLYINNAIRIRARCHNLSYSTSCGSSSFFHLQKGDKVWVQVQKAGKFWPTYHSFFYGALMFPDA